MRIRGRMVLAIAMFWVSACATAPYEPADLDSVGFRAKATSQISGSIEVRAAVPGPDETQALFDLPLYARGIQPVWLEVRNGTDSQIRYAPVGTDREYFSPQEVAYVHHGGFSKTGRDDMNRYFYQIAMPRRIPAGETRSGFVFTHAHLGTKSFNVDLFSPSSDNDLSFTFFLDVPGFEPDHSDAYFGDLYAIDEIRDLDRNSLRAELAGMDRYTRDQSGEGRGVPINVVVIGEPEDVLQALIRAGWTERPRTELEMASASELFFGRVADVVFTKLQKQADEGNELRFWLSPVREQGTRVWFAQVTRHVSVGKGRGHLDPKVDDAAAFLLQDLWYAQGLARYAWVRDEGGVATGVAISASPARSKWLVAFDNRMQTFAKTEYFTEGYLAVMWLSGPTVSMLDTDALRWNAGPGSDDE